LAIIFFKLLEVIADKLRSILSHPSASKSLRMNIRRLVTKLGKKIGWEKLRQDFMPHEHWPLVRYAERFHKRDLRNRLAQRDNHSSEDESDLPILKQDPHGRIIITESQDDPSRGGEREINIRKTRKETRRNIKQSPSHRHHEIVGENVIVSRSDAKRRRQKLEPFAYVRLNPSISKEKHKTNAVASFRRIMRPNK
jgi:hypothetical protein